MPALLPQVRKYFAFRRALHDVLSRPLRAVDCETIIRERLASREESFLRLMKYAVYESSRSPYLPLLRDVGITWEDVRETVHKKGIESTLAGLRDEGVYLTFEEYKGRLALIRRGKEYPIRPAAFENPLVHESSYVEHTGGSTGRAVRVPRNVYHEREYAVHSGLNFAHWVPPNSKVCLWRSERPAASIASLVRFSVLGHPPDAWFVPLAGGLLSSVRQSGLLLRTTLQIARRRGCAIPDPQLVPLREAHRIAEWIVAQKRSSPACVVHCNVSSAVHICEAARRRGLDIRGTRFFLISEPLTEAKRDEILAVGGVPLAVYGALDVAGRLGTPCGKPSCADDMHVCSDSFAIIQRRRIRPGSEDLLDAFLVTTLLPSSPIFLLNVEMDDFGTLEERECGCDLEKLGLTQHILHVRSFAKLTTQGTTIPLGDVAWVIEKTLPQRFGGASIHYQLLEEDVGSKTRLTLVVSPEVGPLDEPIVLQTFLSELRSADPRLTDATRLWEQTGALRLLRAEPALTARGKLMPVRIRRHDERSQRPSS